MRFAILFLCCILVVSCQSPKATGKFILTIGFANSNEYEIPAHVPDMERIFEKRLAALGIAAEDVALEPVSGKLQLIISQWSLYRKTVDKEKIRAFVLEQGQLRVLETIPAVDVFIKTCANDTSDAFQQVLPNLGLSHHFTQLETSYQGPVLAEALAKDTARVSTSWDSLLMMRPYEDAWLFWSLPNRQNILSYSTLRLPRFGRECNPKIESATYHTSPRSLTLKIAADGGASWKRLVESYPHATFGLVCGTHLLGLVEITPETSKEEIELSNDISEADYKQFEAIFQSGAFEKQLAIFTEKEEN